MDSEIVTYDYEVPKRHAPFSKKKNYSLSPYISISQIY